MCIMTSRYVGEIVRSEGCGSLLTFVEPPNIFLKSSIDEWRGFPQPVLGDFGNLIPSAEGASEFGTQG